MENKDNNNEQQKSRRPLSRSEAEQVSFVSTQSADSTFTSGSVVDIVMDEKATIMRSPEKTASIFFETRQLSGEDTQTAPNEPAGERSRPRVSFSFPGAFRVSDAQQNDSQQQSVCIESVSSEESEESEVFVIPLASLVEDDKDVEAQNRTSSVYDIMPMAIADERVVVDESAAAQPRRKSKLFRLSVVACLLLIAGILTGLSIALLKRRGRAEDTLTNNSTALPTPLPPPPRHPPSDGSPNGGNSGGDKGKDSGGGNGGGGGDSGGGQGGGGGQRVLRTIMEVEAIDREFGLGNNIEN
jgi:hypothetical protein